MKLHRYCTAAVYHRTVMGAISARNTHNLALKKSDGRPGKEVTDSDGNTQWLLDGVLHRTNGPAQRYKGVDMWLAFGKLHRIGGPAEISVEHRVSMIGASWWIYGIPVDSWESYQAVTKCSNEDLIMLILKWGTR